MMLSNEAVSWVRLPVEFWPPLQAPVARTTPRLVVVACGFTVRRGTQAVVNEGMRLNMV